MAECLRPTDVPPDLHWAVPSWLVQRLYYWAWALGGGWLYGRLHDRYGRGGWRLKTTPELLHALSMVLDQAPT